MSDTNAPDEAERTQPSLLEVLNQAKLQIDSALAHMAESPELAAEAVAIQPSLRAEPTNTGCSNCSCGGGGGSGCASPESQSV